MVARTSILHHHLLLRLCLRVWRREGEKYREKKGEMFYIF